MMMMMKKLVLFSTIGKAFNMLKLADYSEEEEMDSIHGLLSSCK